MKRFVLTALAAAVALSGVAIGPSAAMAQYYDRGPRWDDRGPPPPEPPPPPYRRHHDDGAVIAGGVAAGLLGGLIAGALVNNGGPRYIDPPAPPPPPPPRCWFEERSVRNAYDGGWHRENFRVCD
jgi:hypothetical protein